MYQLLWVLVKQEQDDDRFLRRLVAQLLRGLEGEGLCKIWTICCEVLTIVNDLYGRDLMECIELIRGFLPVLEVFFIHVSIVE